MQLLKKICFIIIAACLLMAIGGAVTYLVLGYR